MCSYDDMDTRLKHPFTCIVAGPTGCGKTTFVTRILQHASSFIVPLPENVVWCYGEWQHLWFTGQVFVRFEEEKPGDRRRPDLMNETDGRVTNLFTKKSHHCNTSVVYLVQSMFPKKRESRTISLNAQYIVAFKNPRDATHVTHLARQMYPGRMKYMQEAFKDTTSGPYGYLLIDLKEETPEHLRLRTNVFPDEVQYTYLPKT